MFVENVSKDCYIYLEEVAALQGFKFWPHTPIDIEKPASVSKDHEFVWRLPLSSALQLNDYVFDVNSLSPETLQRDKSWVDLDL